MARWVPPYLHDGLFNIASTLAGFQEMEGHFKVNGVGTLWLSGDDEVMAKEVGAVMIV